MAYDFTILKTNLEEKGYKVSVFSDKESAADYLNQQIDGKTVGMGGSVTLQELDVF